MPAEQLKPDSGFDSMKNAIEKWQSNLNHELESEKSMKRESSSFFSLRNLVIFGIGGFIAYQNRFRLMRFLESQGIKTPWLNDNLGETVKSAGAKVAGRVDRELDRAV